MLGTAHNLVRRGSSRADSQTDSWTGLGLHLGLGDMKGRTSPSSPWRTIAKQYVIDYIVLLLILVILCWAETAEPFHRVIYANDDDEFWRYSYPLVPHDKQHVPAWTVPVLATCGPSLVFVMYYVVASPSRLEMHNTLLGLFSAVLTTALVTNIVKLGVGRPRPNFMRRCWPDGGPPAFDEHGLAKCAGNAVGPWEGRKSFPSGHTSWSTSGLGYLTLWAAGKLRCFDGGGHPWRLLLSGLPLCGAAWIGITRLQDYWHHWEDVLVGFLLGFGLAYAFYRQHFPCVTNPRCSTLLLASGEGLDSGTRSGMSLSTALDDDGMV